MRHIIFLLMEEMMITAVSVYTSSVIKNTNQARCMFSVYTHRSIYPVQYTERNMSVYMPMSVFTP